MGKLISSLLFVLSFCHISNAQWITGGTQVSFGGNESHRPFVSAIPGGGFYTVWQATDTTSAGLSSIKLCAYDSNGVILNGWPTGGLTLTPAGGDFFGAQLITSEDGNVIVSWYGFASGSNQSQIYIQKYSIGGGAMWNSGGAVHVTDSAFVNEYPMIVSDKHRGAYLAWNRF